MMSSFAATERSAVRLCPRVLKFVDVQQLVPRIVIYLGPRIVTPPWARGYSAPFDM